jgi:hypothetical protein
LLTFSYFKDGAPTYNRGIKGKEHFIQMSSTCAHVLEAKKYLPFIRVGESYKNSTGVECARGSVHYYERESRKFDEQDLKLD